jgi:hypothetical protein
MNSYYVCMIIQYSIFSYMCIRKRKQGSVFSVGYLKMLSYRGYLALTKKCFEDSLRKSVWQHCWQLMKSPEGNMPLNIRAFSYFQKDRPPFPAPLFCFRTFYCSMLLCFVHVLVTVPWALLSSTHGIFILPTYFDPIFGPSSGDEYLSMYTIRR